MSRIGKVIDGLDAPALRRILDAPLEAWAFHRYRAYEGDQSCARCFVGHALDFRDGDDVLARYLSLVCNRVAEAVVMRQAELRILIRGRGERRKPRLIRAIKIRALKALERGSSQEFEGLPRREMRPTTHVSCAPKAKVQRLRPGRARAHGTACACDEPQ